MNEKKDWSTSQESWPWWQWVLTGFSVLAAALSIYLSTHLLLGGQLIGCSGGSSCDEVITSKWSMLGGVLPVSSLAVGVYLALFVASFYVGLKTDELVRRLAWKAALILIGAVAGSALWLIGVQIWLIGRFCPYCMTTHCIGLILTVLIVWKALQILRPLQIFALFLTGLILAGILVMLQVQLAPKTAYIDGQSQEIAPIVDVQNAPLIGPRNAPYKVTLLFDYNCTHCQKIHFMLEDVVHRCNGKLAIILCPTPLNTKCNNYVPRDVDVFRSSCELARLSLAVWRADRNAFPRFEKWLFTYDSGDKWQPRSLDAARLKAKELIGSDKLKTALTDVWLNQYIQTSVQLFGQTLKEGKGGIPKLIYGSRWIIPEPSNADDLSLLLQTSLNLPIQSEDEPRQCNEHD